MAENEPETVRVKFVQCTKCGSTAKKSEFDMAGTSLRGCRCKPGEEKWRVIELDVVEDGRPRKVIPPAPR